MTDNVQKTRKRRGHGEGAIFKRADGRWCGSISLGYAGTGKRRRKYVYGETKSEVAKQLRKLQSQNDAGALADSDGVKLSEWIDHWLEHDAKPKVRPSTFKRYSELAVHIDNHIGGCRLSNLRWSHVEGLYSALAKSGLSKRTQEAVAQVLCAALKSAVQKHLVPFSAAACVTKPRHDDREMKTLTADEMDRLLKAATGDWHHAMIAVACGSGARLGELAALEWGDVDLDQGTISIRRALSTGPDGPIIGPPKSKYGVRVIALPDYAVAAIRSHRAAMLKLGLIAKPVFCNTVGGYLEKVNFLRRNFKPLLKRASLPQVRFHDLRHSHCSQLLSQGQSVKAVSLRMGHHSCAFTLDVYGHPQNGDDEKLAKALNRQVG